MATLFRDRGDAARQLAQALAAYRGQHPLILAIPRGAVPMGRVLAASLGGDLDVTLVRKLGAPGNPELAVGAVDESGWTYVAPHAREVGADAPYLAREKSRQLDVIARRRALYTPDRPPIDPAGRVVIVIDDGLATGATMIAALHAIRQRHPAKLVCAVPVAARDSLAHVRDYADEVVCPYPILEFGGISQFYGEFTQVDDEEVVAALRRAGAPAPVEDDGARTAPIRVRCGRVELEGMLERPAHAIGVVLFAHGSGSSRFSPRNNHVAQVLRASGVATALIDLLAVEEEDDIEKRFDIGLLAERLDAAATAVRGLARVEAGPHIEAGALPLGLFGASTGAAAALRVAARRPDAVRAVVSRGGRPDLTGDEVLAEVRAPTLLIVGGLDTPVIGMNREAYGRLGCEKELVIVPGATHLFEEPGTLDEVARLAAAWFVKHLGREPSA